MVLMDHYRTKGVIVVLQHAVPLLNIPSMDFSLKTELVEANSTEKGEMNDRDDLSGRTMGLTSREAGLVLSMMGLANCCGRIGFGQALDWWKDKVLSPSQLVLTSIEILRLLESLPHEL